MRQTIPVIDLFAGPGGLGEGFSSYRPDRRKTRAFKIAVSVEKDPWAHRTLLLRSFYRQFARREIPEDYYKHLRGDITLDALFENYPFQARAARAESMHAELGKDDEVIFARIERHLNRMSSNHSVLIGGPPCQAYSVAGRARMKDSFSTDDRQVLYQEYLKIIARFQPAVFVMENVKGMLSSQARLDENAKPNIGGTQERIFHRILRDLKNPLHAVQEVENEWDEVLQAENVFGYRVYSLLIHRDNPNTLRPADFIIRSEDFGIPQTRHRVILIGVRNDIPYRPEKLVRRADGRVHIDHVIGDLPHLRSQISKRNPLYRDSAENWQSAIRRITEEGWFDTLRDHQNLRPNQLDLFTEQRGEPNNNTLQCALRVAAESVYYEAGTGGSFVEGTARPAYRADWYHDPRLGGFCNHESRSHMVSDLHRYLFLACFAHLHGYSPTIRAFPHELLPAHRNVTERQEGEEDIFDDRFRVQVAGSPATTITSHISKDGHYNVHYDPLQCRSLTVREAARVQTFPDNYFFEGPRTEQYHQVGNAVPPLLAYQIAGIVYKMMEEWHGGEGT